MLAPAFGTRRATTVRTITRLRENFRRWFGGRRRVAFVSVAVVVLAAACGGAGPADDDVDMPSISTGAESDAAASMDLAPNFTITLYQGQDKLGAEQVDLSQLVGKPVVLNFWAGLCPPCRAEMPDLQVFYEGFRDQVTLIGIDIGQFTGLGNREDAQELLNELGVTYPAGYTGDAGVVQEYRILGMPTTVFIDSSGEVFKVWTGALNNEVLEEQTRAMMGQAG